jgi:D-galactarolactone isomerase
VPTPSNAVMLDQLLAWADDEATRQRILVDNPAALYEFPLPPPPVPAPVS